MQLWITIEDCADCDENCGDRINENYGDHGTLRHVNGTKMSMMSMMSS